MDHHKFRLFSIIIVVAVETAMFAKGALCVDFPKTHHLYIDGSEAKKTFIAKIDDQRFDTLTALESYLVALPAGDGVNCRYYIGKIGKENPDWDQLSHTVFVLKGFCKDHHILFSGGGSST